MAEQGLIEETLAKGCCSTRLVLHRYVHIYTQQYIGVDLDGSRLKPQIRLYSYCWVCMCSADSNVA